MYYYCELTYRTQTGRFKRISTFTRRDKTQIKSHMHNLGATDVRIISHAKRTPNQETLKILQMLGC